MTVYLCIDLMGGKAVQLIQGKKKALEVADVLGLAKELARLGNPVDVIDLDAAMGKGDNLKLIKLLCKKLRCRVGGGIRSIGKAKELMKAGAERIIIGTTAFKEGKLNEEFLSKLEKEIGKERIIISVDSLKGNIVDMGWTHSTGIKTLDIIKSAEKYCSEIFYTYVDKEGMMKGTDFDTIKKIRKSAKVEVTAAGGISSPEEVERLESMGVNSVIGMAYYTRKITMEQLIKIKKI
jgi:phosphoribosylformimino-5-aminoimidazole carboxamide ribotide isomerase